MNTFTLNRNLDSYECQFVALNDGTYAQLSASRCMDSRVPCRVIDANSLSARIRRIFRRR